MIWKHIRRKLGINTLFEVIQCLREEINMPDITALQASVDALKSDVATEAAAIKSAIDDLKAQIAALSTGTPITQQQIDAMTSTVNDADSGVKAMLPTA